MTGTSTETVVVMGANYWGKGATVVSAKAEFQRQGGRLKNGYAVLTFDPETEFTGVDQMGRYFFKGNEPTIEIHKPKGKR